VTQSHRVRPIRAAERPRASVLLRQALLLHARIASPFFKAPEPTELEVGLVCGPSQQTLVALTPRDTVIGLCRVRLYETPARSHMRRALRALVEDLVVAPRHRRSGVGRALLEGASEWARAQGASQLILTLWEGNQPAQRFYERLGYRCMSRVLGIDL
jgi:GNAT superfamily N-acetyltransferase